MDIANIKNNLVKIKLKITKFVNEVSEKLTDCKSQLQSEADIAKEKAVATINTAVEGAKLKEAALERQAEEAVNTAVTIAKNHEADLERRAVACYKNNIRTAFVIAKLQAASFKRRSMNRYKAVVNSVELAVQKKSNQMNETRRKLHQMWSNNHSFTLWVAPADGSLITKKHFKKTSLKYAAWTFTTVLCSLLVTIGVLGYFAHVNETQKRALEEFQKTRMVQEQTIKELKEIAEKNQQQLAYLSKLEDKVRNEMKKNGTELPPKQEITSFAGTGGPNIAGATQTDIVLLQEMNIKKEADAKAADLENLLNTIENENYRRQYTPSVWPTAGGYVSSYFGGRSNPFDGYSSDWHSGIDIANNYGAPVYATASGYVTFSGWYGGYGRYIEINHDFGFKTAYAHMSSLAVSSGSYVEKGDIIGYVGSSGNSTGPHLHFEVHRYGEEVNPLDYV